MELGRFIRTLSVSSSSRNLGSKPVSQDREYTLQKLLVSELHGGDVHCHRNQGQAGIHPGTGLRTSFAKDPFVDRHNQAGVFGDRNKFRRRYWPRVGCVQRSKASAPVISPVLRLTLGW